VLGREVENEIRSGGGEACYIRADVRDKQDVKAFVDQTVQKYGQLNVAFDIALIPGTTDTELVRRAAGMEDVPDAVWEALAKQGRRPTWQVSNEWPRPRRSPLLRWCWLPMTTRT
jgi:NAD(P)-dependent dehydrogenase (short-subunit alcohol dehydrogenase family)